MNGVFSIGDKVQFDASHGFGPFTEEEVAHNLPVFRLDLERNQQELVQPTGVVVSFTPDCGMYIRLDEYMPDGRKYDEHGFLSKDYTHWIPEVLFQFVRKLN